MPADHRKKMAVWTLSHRQYTAQTVKRQTLCLPRLSPPCYDVVEERAMIELTTQQHESLMRNGTEPIRAIDRATNVEYVLVRADVYERLKGLLSDDMPETGALMNEVMADDDDNDPLTDLRPWR